LLELVALASSSFVIALSGALIPGPLLTLTISESAKRGAKAGPLLIVGHVILEGVLVVLLLGGLSAVMTNILFMLVSFCLGGAILLIMGFSMLRGSASINFDIFREGESKGGNIILLGIVGSLSNPYFVIWWATIGLGYLVSSIKLGVQGAIAFFIGHILADFVWYALVSVAISRGREIFPVKVYRRLVFCCGSFLILFGVWFLAEGVKVGLKHVSGEVPRWIG
jgi:threonine/homoserine/homoserine lactone efflux protein